MTTTTIRLHHPTVRKQLPTKVQHKPLYVCGGDVQIKHTKIPSNNKYRINNIDPITNNIIDYFTIRGIDNAIEYINVTRQNSPATIFKLYELTPSLTILIKTYPPIYKLGK